MIVRLSILFFFLLNISKSLAQETLRGTVRDAKDSTALANVSVHFDGTTIGTITRSDGSFSLPDQYHTSLPVIISYLGYATVVVSSEDLQGSDATIYLKETVAALDAVVFDDDPWSRKKKLFEFKSEFLGRSVEAEKCSIKNPEALRLRYSPTDQTLYADADEPIIVINKHLGYELHYQLINFSVLYQKAASGSVYPYNTYMEGVSFFTELRNPARKRHLKNRQEAYLGSLIHFMRSLSKEQLSANNFSVFVDRKEVQPYSPFEFQMEADGVKVFPNVNEIDLLYDKNYQSNLQFKIPFVIDRFGNHTPPYGVTVGGAMGMRRIAALLPLNYGLEPKHGLKD